MHKEAVVFGAGNIGRGFLGQLLCESGYLVTFVDVDRVLLDALNRRGAYTLRLVTNDSQAEVIVGPVRGLHAGDANGIARAISRAGIGMTAVGAGVLPHIAGAIAQGIARRAREHPDTPFNIIVCENLHGAAAHLRGLVSEALNGLASREPTNARASAATYMTRQIGFVDTVIARMVPPLTPALRDEDPSQVIVEPYKELPVDRDGFVGPPPEIVGMRPYAPFAFFTERKLYIHNAGHAVLAYLGYQAGYEYGYQALGDEAVYAQTRGAMTESAVALARKFHPAACPQDGPPGGAPWAALQANIEDLLHRFGNRALGDTVLRLGRDPIRKLARSDRLVGAALNALGQDVEPVHLVAGLTAALRFDHPDDPVARDLQARLAHDGIARVLAEVCGLSPDEALFERILRCYQNAR